MGSRSDGIKAALDTLVSAVLAEREWLPSGPLRLVLAAEFSEVEAPTRAEAQVSSLIRNPVGAALRQAVGRLGQAAYDELGSVDALRQIAERVAGREPSAFGRRLNVMDHAFDGVGSGRDVWRC